MEYKKFEGKIGNQIKDLSTEKTSHKFSKS